MSVSFADNVPHQTGRQLGGGSSTAVGPAPVVPPAGPTAGSMPQPGTARDLIRLAKEANDQLLGSPNASPITMQIINSVGKPYFLHVSDQADVGMDCGLNRATEVVPVLCVPGSSWPNPPQSPPPFHIRHLANERCDVLWVDPHQPWSAVARGWEKVMWALYWPNGQLVVGLPAAGSSGLLPYRPTLALMQQPTHPTQQPAPQQQHPPAPPAPPCPSHPQVAGKPPSAAKGPNSHPTPARVQQPTHPTQQPACQQHNSGAEQAHVAQLVAGGAPGPPAPHPSCPGLPGGPAPLPAQQACPGGVQEASHGAAPPSSAGPAPGNADGSGQAAADTLQGQGEVPGRTAAEVPGRIQGCVEGRSRPAPPNACQTGGVTEPGIKPEPGLQPGACGTAETGQGRGTREAPIELSDDTGDEADADDDQDMDVMDPMSGDDAPLPAALTESPGAAAHGQAPVAPDGAGPSSAPWPAAAPGNLAAAALVDAAGPGNDPLPYVAEWSSYRVPTSTDLRERCLERVPRLAVKHLGLKLEARPCVPILVALALERPHALGADHGHGSLHLLYAVKPGTRGRWTGKKRQLNAWVTKSRFQLTGRFKAQRAGPEQGGPHLLVLEVRPLLQAATQAACATPARSRAAAVSGQPGCNAQATAGAKPRKRGGREQDGLDGPAKRHSGLVPRVLCVGGGEADPATGQDQEGPAQEVAGAEEVPPAALTGLPTTRVSNEAALSPAATSNHIHTGSSAQAAAAARQSKSTGSELAAAEGRMKRSSGSGHCETSDTSDEADTDDDQDMDVMEPMSGDDAPQPTALPEVPGTAVCGQAPVAPDGAGPSSAPGPAAAPGSLAAAALVDAAGPGVDPLPHVKTWGTYSVGARCLEVVQMPIVEQLALEGAEPGSRVPILVALALELTEQPHAPGGHQGLGSLHLLCVAMLSCGVKVRWRLRIDPSIHQSTVYKRTMLQAWVRDCNLQMTGRFKARRAGPQQGGPHLLVLEVRPLLQAAAQTDFTTPVCSRAAATPDQPGCSAQATAGVNPRKRTRTEQEGSEGPAKRHGGLVPRMLCVGSGEADPASGQDQEAAAQEVAGAEEQPAAALTGLSTTRGVREAADRSLGPSRSGAVPGAAMPPCQAALLAMPGTPSIGSPASPHSQPATPTSCPNPCLASDGGPTGNLEPIGGQQDGAQASNATDPGCPLSEAGHTSGPKPMPNSVSERVHRAEAVRLNLLHTRSEWDFALKPLSDAGSFYLRNFIAQPIPPGDWEEQDMDFVIPVVCVTHDDLSSPHQLPPPFLIRTMWDHQLAVVWKPPDWPWSSVQQHWERVVWTALTQGHMVVGLQASSNASH